MQIVMRLLTAPKPFNETKTEAVAILK